MAPPPKGAYYPRIFRPAIDRLVEYPEAEAAAGVVSDMLARSLSKLLEVVEPVPDNFETFGHAIRLHLIATCTEVEAGWVSVLKANGVLKDRYTTSDYVKLLDPMQLDQYEVRMLAHPTFPPFKPFATWDPNRATQSLPWYDAYNATKHDREANLRRATVRLAIEATGALLALTVAQFGAPNYISTNGGFSTLLVAWGPNLNADNYESPPGTEPWRSVPYPF
jgi:hypothetical protein